MGKTVLSLHIERLPDKPCDTFNTTARLDSEHLWLFLLQAFPGSGRDYPIAPGQAKVIAMDAMNHIAASPTTNQVDLSNADFEQHGNDADIDNVFVPDLVNVRVGAGALGRGYPIQLGTAYALVLPVPSAQFDSGSVQTTGTGQFVSYLVPKSKILDVMSVGPYPHETSGGICTPFLSPVFERDLARFGSHTVRKAMRRKSLGFTSTGVELLQRTRTSSRDLELADPLRRSLLK